MGKASGTLPPTAEAPLEDRFSIEVLVEPARDSTLAEDVRLGLSRAPKSIPPKHFYDDRGSTLFDAICDLPEYYLTRAEHALLRRSAGDILSRTQPTDLVELGSGTSRKTRILLDEAARRGADLVYHPVDVCEPILRSTGGELLADYPWLVVRALAADYERHLDHLPGGTPRLVAFLGSTIGNFANGRAETFLAEIAAALTPGEHLLLGADLVKPVSRLEAAYNDSAGVTAEFNRNVLLVINRELDAGFEPADFDHVAFFNGEESQIEMHLRARRPLDVPIRKLGMQVRFEEGETIHTETSRKFTRRSLSAMLEAASLSVEQWYVPEDDAFALLLARKRQKK